MRKYKNALLLILLMCLITTSKSFGQNNSVIINGAAYIVLKNGTQASPIYMVINQNSTSGIVTTGGWIISEGNYNYLKWNAGSNTGSYVFPFGYNTTDYIPFTFNKTTGSASDLSISTWSTNQQNMPHAGITNGGTVPAPYIMDGTLSGIADSVTAVVDRWWDIYPTSAITGDLTFSYRAAENTTADPTNILMAQHWNGTSWDTPVGVGDNGVTTGIGTVSAMGVSQFSPYVIVAPCTNDSVTLSFSSDTICAGELAILSASGMDSYVWSTTETTSTINVSPLANTTYTVVGTTGFCTDTATVSIVVNSNPVLSINALSDTICAGASAMLTVSGADSYLWNTTETNDTITVAPLTTTTYNVVGTTGICSSDTATVTVVVIPIPVVNIIASSDTICSGTTVVLGASGANNYSWSTSEITTTIMVTPSITTTYTVVGTSASCGTDTATITIEVNPTPVVSINTPNDTICSGNSAILTASGADDYLWSTTETTTSITVTPGTTTTYTVVGTTGSCSSTSATLTVVVNPTPIVSINASNDTICSGASATLTATGADAYVWNTTETTAVITVTPATTTSYTVIGTTGFCTDTATVTIEVNPTPVVSINTPNDTICSGTSAILTVSGADNYLWNTTETNDTIIVAPLTTTTYSVVGTTGSCSSTSTALTVVVNPTPSVSINASNDTICSGASATLTASGADSYVWSTTETTASITVAPGATTSYTVVGTTGACSSTSNAFTVVVNPTPSVSINASNDTICAGNSLILPATGADSYVWSTTETTASITVTPGATTTYTVVGTTGACSSDTSSITIVVNPVPVAIASNDVTVCVGDPLQLTGNGGSLYAWSGPVSYTSNEQSPLVTASITTDQAGWYILTVTNANGCQGQDSTLVQVGNGIDCFDIPGVITPNGDGLNDAWVIPFTNANVEIYNRWGNLVFKATPYTNDWSGAANNGVMLSQNGKLPSGTYFYIIQLDDADSTIVKGYVELQYE